jgi:hypothetical protein
VTAYVGNIERETLANEDYRRVLFTGVNTQLVLMTLRPGDEIGEETHAEHDQFIRVEAGMLWSRSPASATLSMMGARSSFPLARNTTSATRQPASHCAFTRCTVHRSIRGAPCSTPSRERALGLPQARSACCGSVPFP